MNEYPDRRLSSAALGRRRVSCATLSRVPYMDGRLLLTLNKNRLKKNERQYSPFGGAIEFFGIVRLDNSIDVTFEKSPDLRLLIREEDLGSFETWFRSRQDRETDPFRELYEEIVEEERLLTNLDRSKVGIRFSHLDVVNRRSTRTNVEGALTRYYFEVFDVELDEGYWKEINSKLGQPDCRARLISEAEITQGLTEDGITIAENCESLVPSS